MSVAEDIRSHIVVMLDSSNGACDKFQLIVGPLDVLQQYPRIRSFVGVHGAARPERVRVALTRARQIVQVWDGVVYDPQTDEII